MYKGILVKCNNPAKSSQISSFCEEKKKPSTLPPSSPPLSKPWKQTQKYPLPPPLGSKTHPKSISLVDNYYLYPFNQFFIGDTFV